MDKATVRKLIVLIGLGLGTFVALAFTDFGLSGGALAGAFTMLAVALEDRRCERRRRSAGS